MYLRRQQSLRAVCKVGTEPTITIDETAGNVLKILLSMDIVHTSTVAYRYTGRSQLCSYRGVIDLIVYHRSFRSETFTVW